MRRWCGLLALATAPPHTLAQAVKELLAVCARMRARWALCKVAVVHRLGVVPVGQASVIVAVSSAHRAEALAATAYGIDELKAR
jgi:molybdopterin synthase catalytic subunit